MDTQAELRAYYEEEARLGERGPLRGRRLELRNDFIELLASEGRRSVVDFGAGPGFDAEGFLAAGHAYLGLDLAVGNAVLAAQAERCVVPGSILAPPLRANSFDAGWSMSTLMHLTEAQASDALLAMAAVLRPGAPLLVGQWGGGLGDQIDDARIPGQRRLFSLRSADLNRELLSAIGTIGDEQIWAVGPAGWNYFVATVRLPD